MSIVSPRGAVPRDLAQSALLRFCSSDHIVAADSDKETEVV